MEEYIKMLKESIEELEKERDYWKDLAFKLMNVNKKLGDKLNEV